MKPWLAVLLGGCGGTCSPEPLVTPPPDGLRCPPIEPGGSDDAARAAVQHHGYADCFVKVPGGTVVMGAQSDDPLAPSFDLDALPHEGPPRVAQVSDLWVMADEASAALWDTCVRDGACDPANAKEGAGLSTWGTEDAWQTPMNNVNWRGAAQACGWLGGRLLTEAEWAWVARGPEALRFTWGTGPCPHVTPQQTHAPDPTAPKSLRCPMDQPIWFSQLHDRTRDGVRGMAGNVWEWVDDPFDGDPNRRVQRGGGWTAETVKDLRAASRGGVHVDQRLSDVGFRCAWGAAHQD